MPVENAAPTRLSGAEVVARGKALHEANIRALVEPADIGRFIAVDVETGDFLVADEYLDAAHKSVGQAPRRTAVRHAHRLRGNGGYRRTPAPDR